MKIHVMLFMAFLCRLQALCNEPCLLAYSATSALWSCKWHLQPVGRHDGVELVGDRLRDGGVASAAAAAVAALLRRGRAIAALLRRGAIAPLLRRCTIPSLLRGAAIAPLLRGVLLLAVALLLAAV